MSAHAGMLLPVLRKAPLTSSHLVRWSAAMRNWEKIHYDKTYTRDVAKLPGTLINGSLKQHFLAQFLTEAFGATGSPFRLDYRFVGMDLAGESLIVPGELTRTTGVGSSRIVEVDLQISDVDQKRVTTKGKGVVVLMDGSGALTDIDAQAVPAQFQLSQDIAALNGDVPAQVRDQRDAGCRSHQYLPGGGRSVVADPSANDALPHRSGAARPALRCNAPMKA